MWGTRYWGASYFGARYWGKVGATPAALTLRGTVFALYSGTGTFDLRSAS